MSNNITTNEGTTLDQILSQIAESVSELPSRSVALFFAACAERFFPLFQAFVVKEGWGNYHEMRKSLDCAWFLLTEGRQDKDLLHKVIGVAETMTPHADDFSSLECIFAQDVCVLLDTTARSLLAEAVDPRLVDYSFEGLRAAICEEDTGFMDLGDSERANDFEKYLVTEPRIRREIENQRKDIISLQSTDVLDKAIVDTIWHRSSSRPWSATDFSKH